MKYVFIIIILLLVLLGVYITPSSPTVSGSVMEVVQWK